MITQSTADRMERALKSILEDECIPASVWSVTLMHAEAIDLPHHKLLYDNRTGQVSAVTADVTAEGGMHLSVFADTHTYDPSIHIDKPETIYNPF